MPSIHEYIKLAEAARLLSKPGEKPLHPSTLYRWCVDGVDDICLEHWRIGRKMYTTEKALEAFSKQRSDLYEAQRDAKRDLKQGRKNKPRPSRKKRDSEADAILKGYGIDTE